jgi:hypothetical protein
MNTAKSMILIAALLASIAVFPLSLPVVRATGPI